MNFRVYYRALIPLSCECGDLGLFQYSTLFAEPDCNLCQVFDYALTIGLEVNSQYLKSHEPALRHVVSGIFDLEIKMVSPEMSLYSVPLLHSPRRASCAIL
jgi:hypothetical protein